MKWAVAAVVAAAMAVAPLAAVVTVALMMFTGNAGTCPAAATAGPGGGDIVGAGTYGGPGDPASGDTGAYGPLRGHYAFAELSNNYDAPLDALDFSALGHLPPHALLQITYGERSVIAEKLDVGAGGPPVGDPPTPRRIDLWHETAEALGFSGVGLVSIAPAPPGADPSVALVPGGGGAPTAGTQSSAVCPLPVGNADANALLANPRVQFTRDSQRDDLAQGRIDPHVVAALDAIARTHTIVITSLRSDHSPCAGGTAAETPGGCANGVSNHTAGRAADIGAVDGEPVGVSSGAARHLVDEIVATNDQMGLTELGQPFYDRTEGVLYLFTAGHGDHVHIGIDG